MNSMQLFQNSEFGELGVLEIDGKPYFPATTCAKALGYVKPHNAIAQHCRYSLKQGVPHPQNPDKVITVNFIPEGDLYRLITHSKLPAAERFEKWVFDEVLPSIRQTGSYSQPGAAQPFTMEQTAQFAAAVAAQVVTQIVPVIISTVKEVAQPVEPARPVPWERVWNSNSHPGPRKDIVTRPPATKGTLRIETFPLDIVRAVDSMMEQMMEEQALNFSEIARYCTGQGYTISSPSVRRYYDKHFNRH